MIDKFGTSLKVGDWILYHYWNEFTGGAFYAAKITMIWGTGNTVDFIHNDARVARDYSDIEWLPKDKKKREQILFLKKLEQ
jgi:hypothetical protein